MRTAPAHIVTGYVRLDSEHRGHERYTALGQQLVDVGLPTVAFLDPSAVMRSRPKVNCLSIVSGSKVF